MNPEAEPVTEPTQEKIKETWRTPYLEITDDLYPVLKKKFTSPEVDSTDGIGTKGIFHWQQRTFREAAIDALAMNLNDLAMMRATPYKLQDHITLPREDPEARDQIMDTLITEASKRDIAITGGETSYHNNTDSLEISITASGLVSRPRRNQTKTEDLIIGLRSHGLHSNGFRQARATLGEAYREEFTEPTAIYAETVLDLDTRYAVHGLMHITGGAYTKLHDVMDEKQNLYFSREHALRPQPIFQELHDQGLSDEEMYQTFNCGIGFMLTARANEADAIVGELGDEAAIIGKVEEGSGLIIVESQFSAGDIVL